MTPLPDGGLLLHIGPPKSGSTAIQRALAAVRDDLATYGVHYPGPHYRMSPRAGHAVLGMEPLGRSKAPMELWQQVVADVRATDLPKVCLSDEDFARADDAAVDRIADSLGAERIHLVWVARRIDKMLPSQWQERLKSTVERSYPDYLDHMLVHADRPDAVRSWHNHDVAGMVARWSRRVDPSRITVVVADEDDRSALPRAFEALLGLPEGLLVPPAERSNRSLTLEEAEAVRTVNRVAREEGWSAREYRRIVQTGVANRLKDVAPPAGTRPIPGIPSAFLALVHDRADAQASAVAGSGIQVIGDPDLLRTRDRVHADDAPATVDVVPLDLVANLVSGVRAGTDVLREADVRRASRAASKPGIRDVARRLRGR
ncbi:MAG: hypothetical protein JWO46_557 [Nocardioidaceae bacterium]|nr:hypothetical protein [Nocardioidaceae bacterium]